MDAWLAETILDVIAAILMGVVALWVLRGLFHAFGSGPARSGTLASHRSSASARPSEELPAADPPTARRS